MGGHDEGGMLSRLHAVALAVTVLIGAVVIYLLGTQFLGEGGSSPGENASGSREPPVEPPGEYLYLDNARVLAYSSQVEGGVATSETRSATLTRDIKFGVKAEAIFEAGGSAQNQDFIERVVRAHDLACEGLGVVM
jgi:hypothetical protein